MSGNRGLTNESERILAFEERDDGPGIAVVDTVERRRCEVCTSGPVSPREVTHEEFHLPIDRAVAITTERVSVPHTVMAYIRDRRGTVIEEASKRAKRAFPNEYYQVELATPIKLYVAFAAGFEITVTEEEVTLGFDGETEVYLGARSNHDHPEATITTTDDPGDVMRAISTFGSALETTTCERSYPTLRGHPPRIERGDRLFIPDSVETPNTGTTIEIPPTRESAYVVASLAYYLGADIARGSDPRIVTDDGFVHRLDGPRGFEGEVERVLKQCFFFDCVTRTEGYYPVDLHERNEVEDEVAFDFSTLYGRPLAEQLEAYLDVPYEIVEPHVPRWSLSAHVDPTDPAHVETIPFLVQDLAVIRSKEGPSSEPEPSSRTAESLGIPEFVRDRREGPSNSNEIGDNGEARTVRIEGTDALEDVWIGDGIPIGASKGMIEAYQNRLERTPSEGDIDITVVVNDPEMVEEGRDVNEVYGSENNLPLDVTIYQQLTKEKLSDVIYKDTDFFHYIGHADVSGFECEDGILNVEELSTTGVDAFFLNACNSYQQGKWLIKRGATAGAVSLSLVSNREAKQMGEKLARLLNLGFSLHSAVDIGTTGRGSDYVIVGDGKTNIAQPTGKVASLFEIENSNRKYKLRYKTRETRKTAIGSIIKPFVKKNEECFLIPGEIKEYILSEKDLRETTSMEDLPVIIDSEMYFIKDS